MSLLSMSDIAGVPGPGPGVTGAIGGVELQVSLDSVHLDWMFDDISLPR